VGGGGGGGVGRPPPAVRRAFSQGFLSQSSLFFELGVT